jgi:hypothetical protein
MKSSISLDTVPCSPLKVNRRFEGTCSFHLQGLRISQASGKRLAIRAIPFTKFRIIQATGGKWKIIISRWLARRTGFSRLCLRADEYCRFILSYGRDFLSSNSLLFPVEPEMSLLATIFHTGFLLGLFFGPEDGDDMFLRNVVWLSTDYTALYRRRRNSFSLQLVVHNMTNHRPCEPNFHSVLILKYEKSEVGSENLNVVNKLKIVLLQLAQFLKVGYASVALLCTSGPHFLCVAREVNRAVWERKASWITYLLPGWLNEGSAWLT